MWQKLKQKLSNTSQKLTDIKSLLQGASTEQLDELEMRLLSADLGVTASHNLIEQIKKQSHRGNEQQLLDTLHQSMCDLMCTREQPIVIDENANPFIILIVGVNGSGKTTTAGKLANYYKQQNYSVMLAAGDTFRAAAIEQIEVWGKRYDIPVIAQAPNADSAAVIYDAYQSAKNKNIDILIADTAGRMHTDKNLMEELKKIRRMLEKQNANAPHETLLVIDGSTGQSTLSQIEQFYKTAKVTGLAVTKLDGSAKGGVLFAINAEFNLPIRFIGVGESGDDLQIFNANDYVSALLDYSQTSH